MRTALCTASRPIPCLRICRSCEATQAPQPLMAESASASSSKSALAMPGLPITFMRSLTGRVAYSASSTRCTNRWYTLFMAMIAAAACAAWRWAASRCAAASDSISAANGELPDAAAAASETAQICATVSPGAPGGASALERLSLRSRAYSGRASRMASSVFMAGSAVCRAPQAALIVASPCFQLHGHSSSVCRASRTRSTSSGLRPTFRSVT